jgi:hypothetical protein
VCAAVNLYDELIAVQDGQIERWPVDARGKSA